MIEKIKAMAKNKNNLLVLVLAGVLLMVIALPVKNEKRKEQDGDGTGTLPNINSDSYLYDETENTGVSGAGYMGSEADYTAMMEQKVAALLEEMEGAGQVRVIITLRSSSEKIVEKEEPVSRTDTTEADSGGGTRTVNSLETEQNTVYTSEGNYSEPYVIKIISPQVEGVVVLAEGAGNGSVSKNISDVIQVLFGIDAHQVKVIRMQK